jgi:hypothetical protein
MVYDPATDFLGLWRASGGNVSKMEMPGLDYVLAALARAGIITLSVSATAPVANQSITAWLQTAVPSWTAEGAFFLWDADASAYAAATPALFLKFLEATAGENGVSWWTSTGGPPLNTVGNDGDFAIRDDAPYGIYGPKAAGAWPADPIPGTADVITSASLDNTFGTAEGVLLTRGPAVWEVIPAGAADTLLVSDGTAPGWLTLTVLLDTLFTNVQGSMLFRNATEWTDLPPGVATQVLQTGGPGADPAWAARSTEFLSGTEMLFRQDAAPTGWTKSVLLDDYGLRVVSGSVGVTPGSAFSTVFAQTQVSGHALTVGEMPSHGHPTGGGNQGGTGINGIQGGATYTGATSPATVTVGNTGGGAAHAHDVNLTLSYVDVIIAVKD